MQVNTSPPIQSHQGLKALAQPAPEKSSEHTSAVLGDTLKVRPSLSGSLKGASLGALAATGNAAAYLGVKYGATAFAGPGLMIGIPVLAGAVIGGTAGGLVSANLSDSLAGGAISGALGGAVAGALAFGAAQPYKEAVILGAVIGGLAGSIGGAVGSQMSVKN